MNKSPPQSIEDYLKSPLGREKHRGERGPWVDLAKIPQRWGHPDLKKNNAHRICIRIWAQLRLCPLVTTYLFDLLVVSPRRGFVREKTQTKSPSRKSPPYPLSLSAQLSCRYGVQPPSDAFEILLRQLYTGVDGSGVRVFCVFVCVF